MDGAYWVSFLLPAFTRQGHEYQDLESMLWNACVHRLDLSLYSHPKEFLGNGVRSYVDSKRKIPSTRGSEADQTHNTASHKTASPIHYPLSYSGPMSLNANMHPWKTEQHKSLSLGRKKHATNSSTISMDSNFHTQTLMVHKPPTTAYNCAPPLVSVSVQFQLKMAS